MKAKFIGLWRQDHLETLAIQHSRSRSITPPRITTGRDGVTSPDGYGEIALHEITPGLVGEYFTRHTGSIPTKKLHLAAIRRFFDRLVVRHVIVLNPALSVRAERYQVVEGKTPEITIPQARALLASRVSPLAFSFD